MNINDYIRTSKAARASLGVPNLPPIAVPSITCRDGMSLSVQASEYHYCLPRSNNATYTHVEVGFPSEAIPEILEYAEDADRPTDTVYAFVPVEIVDQVIMEHGGISQ